MRLNYPGYGVSRSVSNAQPERTSQRLHDCIRHVGAQGYGRTGAHDLAETGQYRLGIGLRPRCVTGCQSCQQPITQILKRASMAQSRLVAGGAGCDFQRLDGGFLSRLQPLWRGRIQPLVPTAVLGVHGGDIGESGVQRLGHPLRRSVRHAELDADVLKADAATPGGGHLGETEQILSLGERHLTSMPEIDTVISY